MADFVFPAQISPGSIPVQPVTYFPSPVPVSMLRLDLLSSWASGNKYFKLKYFIQEASDRGFQTLVSKGGMYSNHLEAFARACAHFQRKAICLVRAHAPDPESPTMRTIRNLGAQIEFLPPEVYDAWEESQVCAQFPDSCFIPEGGLHVKGIKGAQEISLLVMPDKANQIILAGGSMCTAVGLLSSLSENTTLHIVPAWKGCTDSYVQQLLSKHGIVPACSWNVWPDFHFGGFSKWNSELLNFMKDFFETTLIPLDPVYTGKMMYALLQMLKDGYFASTDKVLAIHTGGLQGVEGFAYRFPQAWKSYADQIKING